ncbi:MAG: DUF1015 domain-containing protein [Verrucomicrobiae bacterium]|nr:DUF1015 domain-containing protein [Verrucomicrobiae bacterium]
MADVQPLDALLYNSQTIKPADVVTEPYDKITAAMQEAYYKRHPNNVVRIILGQEEPGDDETRNKYTRAAQFFQEWQKQGVLVRAPERAVYAYEQTFELPKGKQHTRRAWIARVRLSEFGEGKILPHERTLSKPKQDRLNLLRATKAHFGQIFLLYKNGINRTVVDSRTEPLLEFQDEHGIQHRLRAVTDATHLRQLRDYFLPKTLYIADGHHRYETALAFRDEMRKAFPDAGPEAAHEFVMATLVDMNDPGLFILPTHRLISNVAHFDEAKLLGQLEEWFSVEPEPSLDSMLANMRKSRPGERMFGLSFPADRYFSLKLDDRKSRSTFFARQPVLWENLDVAILHVLILERLLGIDETRLREEANIRYFREPETAARAVLNGKGQMAFYLNPTRVDEVRAVADARSRMPQKSTDFYPKLPAGLVVYPI